MNNDQNSYNQNDTNQNNFNQGLNNAKQIIVNVTLNPVDCTLYASIDMNIIGATIVNKIYTI